ncbi:ABC-F family ATP-binding cassette domain-containing protein [Leucobacter sp. UCMA 4100]|nr:ABC-F family ATP-binding cassette domain-containing protein [Leucobacter sp. UCMA 4100]MDA3146366.1 ABC-F family ATP-binding cassette domain-containing protein [Leucobacter sp. UCMA 4100]
MNTSAPVSAASSITLQNVSFEWPDGSPALSGINGSFTPGKTGLIGRNGSGKSTLLKLIAGELTPTSGRIDVAGEVGYLTQTLTLSHDTTIAELLGIHPVLEAMREIERGNVEQSLFDTIGDDWDIEARADQALHQIGFSAADLDRRVTEVSGGEAMLIAITGLRVRRTPITLLDEPTNNLDRETRAKLAHFVDDWPGTLVIVSHDLELLERMDHTAELFHGSLTTFGGPYSSWRAHQEQEQAAAQQAARSAQQALKVEKRQRVEAETKLARRARTAQKAEQSGLPKIIAGMRANRAEVSAGSLRSTHDGKIQAAQAAVDAADARVRDDEHIHLELPDPGVAKGRRIMEFISGDDRIIVQGPERVALVGPNGSGKSTLIERMLRGTGARAGAGVQAGAGAGALAGSGTPPRATGRLLTEHVGFLPQRLDSLDGSASAIDNVRAVATGVPTGTIRNHLARLLLRGAAVDRPVSTLSGGERFRVALARLLFADPPSQLLILDEPTNNLDIESVEQLAEALDAYRGALLIVSHDPGFLERVGVETVIGLEPDGTVTRRRSVRE